MKNLINEPMRGGFVGPGMLDAACPGEIFTSPTPDQMFEATKAVDGGVGAEPGMLETVPLVAHKGRASYLGERSSGHQDPGSTSTNYLFESAAQAFTS